MLTRQVSDIYDYIIRSAVRSVNDYIDAPDISGNLNFATIFASSEGEYREFDTVLSGNGTVFDKQTTGTYYKLYEPLTVAGKTISVCRVRKHDSDHTERGYVDFQVRDFGAFKKKYAGRQHFNLLQNEHGIELVELRPPGSGIRIYFPDTWA